jgi:hypothetical protein
VAAIKESTSGRYRNSRSRRSEKGILSGGGDLGTAKSKLKTLQMPLGQMQLINKSSSFSIIPQQSH